MELKVLQQTQKDRDTELAEYLHIPVSEVEQLGIATPNAIRLSTGRAEVLTNGKIDAGKVTALYSSFKHLDLHAYLRTLMFTSIKRRPQSLLKLLSHVNHADRILDYGTGVGSHALIAAEQGAHVTMVDVTGPMTAFSEWRACLRGFSNYEVVKHTSPLPDEHYDHVVCVEVLEHVANPMQTLRRLIKATRHSGHLFILASHMYKDSSGHFKELVDSCIRDTRSVLRAQCTQTGKYEYTKK